MRQFINIVETRRSIDEAMSDYDPPSENPTEVVEYRGLTFRGQDEQGYASYYVFEKDAMVGFFMIDEPGYPRDRNVVIHPELVPEFQRKGYGTIIYDFAEEYAAARGKTLIPSSTLNAASSAFWEKRRSTIRAKTYDQGVVYSLHGGHIDIGTSYPYQPRGQSVVGFEVDEDMQGRGLGKRLLAHAMKLHDDIGAQVSGAASLKIFYDVGFRNPANPHGTLAEYEKERQENSSIFMAQRNKEGQRYLGESANVVDPVEDMLNRANFDENAVDSATSQYCGTFALALNHAMGNLGTLVMFCSGNPDGSPRMGEDGVPFWRHVAVKYKDGFYDIHGKNTADDLIDNYLWRNTSGHAAIVPVSETDLLAILEKTGQSHSTAYLTRWEAQLRD